MAAAPASSEQVNRLYESSSDLMEAAAHLRLTAQSKQTAPAHPAALGCLEMALRELEQAVGAIGDAAGQGTPEQSPARAALMHRGIRNLEIALQDAATAAAAARSLTARALLAARRR
jgi:hypothetical protein